VASGQEVPAGATLVGLALFTEVKLPRAGATPAALLVDPLGDLSGVRVGLPPGEREKAQHDLEASLRAGAPDASGGALGAQLDRLSAMARRENR
jgi:hypothetical protein